MISECTEAITSLAPGLGGIVGAPRPQSGSDGAPVNTLPRPRWQDDHYR
jgi:hypothetical protein